MGNTILEKIYPQKDIREAENILLSHRVRATQNRLRVISVFLRESQLLSLKDVTVRLGNVPDRTTVFRILKELEQKGILREIPDVRTVRYQLLASAMDAGVSILFKCIQCQSNLSLDPILAPAIALPRGYQCQQQWFVLRGLCLHCQPGSPEG